MNDVATFLSRPQAYRVLASLARKGLATRVGPGRYFTRSMRALGTQRAPTGLTMVALTFGDKPYYVGGRSAASLHHLTAQRFHSLLDVYTNQPIYLHRLGSARLVLHPLPRAGTTSGTILTRAQEIDVRVSDPERTVVDLVDRLDRLLGWAETQQLVLDAVVDRRLDVERVVRYATGWHKRSTSARVGVLLDRAGVPTDVLQPLIQTFTESAAQTVLVPGYPRRGHWDSRFRVILNDGPTTLGSDDG